MSDRILCTLRRAGLLYVMGMRLPVSGGGTIEVSFAGGLPVFASEKGITVRQASFMPDVLNHQIVFVFAFEDAQGRVPKRVRVEDVTNPVARLIVDDVHPKLDSSRFWRSEPVVVKKDDPLLDWVAHESMTVLVYRFTIEGQDGAITVLHQQTPMIQPFIKESLRNILKPQ